MNEGMNERQKKRNVLSFSNFLFILFFTPLSTKTRDAKRLLRRHGNIIPLVFQPLIPSLIFCNVFLAQFFFLIYHTLGKFSSFSAGRSSFLGMQSFPRAPDSRERFSSPEAEFLSIAFSELFLGGVHSTHVFGDRTTNAL